VPKAFRGERAAIRALDRDGRYAIFFRAHQIAVIDLNNKSRDDSWGSRAVSGLTTSGPDRDA
jgi:hypothetical protein